MANENMSNVTTTGLYSTEALTTLDPSIEPFYRVWDYMSFYFLYPVWPFALLGNITITCVFCLSPMGTTKTTRMYYVLIAICETGTLINEHGFFYMFSYGFYFMEFDHRISGGVFRWTVESMLGCRIIVVLWFFCETFTNLIIVVLGVERVIALYFPFEARVLITKRKLAASLVVIACFVFAIDFQCVYLLKYQINAYVVRGRACFMAGGVGLYYSVMPLIVYIMNFILPVCVSAVISAIIIFRMRSILVARVTPSAQESGKGPAFKSEFFIIPLIMSITHLVLYVPIAVLRLTVNLASGFLPASLTAILFALGSIWYQFTIVLHLSNFVIYWKRVNGFSKCVKLLWTCKCSELAGATSAD